MSMVYHTNNVSVYVSPSDISASCLPHTFPGLKADSAISGASIFDAIQDTEAFVVANDDLIMVVFRGTHERTDWATNLTFRTKNIPPEWGLGEEDCDVHMVKTYANIRIQFL